MFGSIYSVYWWGETNEPNGWGSIYPFNAQGSIVFADSTLETVDSTKITVDSGNATAADDSVVLSGTLLSDGLTLTGNILLRFAAQQDHTYYTSGSSQMGQVIYTTSSGGYDKMTVANAKSIAMWFANLSDMNIDTWYPLAQTYKVVETESDPDTVIFTQTSITGAQVKYIDSPVASYDGVILLKGGTYTTSIVLQGSAQILTVGEAWNDRDLIKY